jgi:hypothetical protein
MKAKMPWSNFNVASTKKHELLASKQGGSLRFEINEYFCEIQ